MSITDGRWEGNVSFPDMQMVWGAQSFSVVSGTAPLTVGGSGLYSLNVPASTTANLLLNLDAIPVRTGVLASSYDQEQFGTAAGVAGPSSVANTSGPLALSPGFPPITAANMATIAGSINGTGTGIQRGAIPKGIQIDSIDVIYAVNVANATSVQCALVKTVFANGVAPAVSNLIPLGANGLPVATAATPYLTNVPVSSPAMITNSDNIVNCLVNIVTPASSTVAFYGIVTRCHYNFN